jgi:Mn-dependent DtxR family transcriptional regulator
MNEIAKQVLEAMRAVRKANKEVTTHNIAEQLGKRTQIIGSRLQRMAKEGLVRKSGMILQFDGLNRAKNMIWRINILTVRKLEAQECGDIKDKKTSRSTRTMHDVQSRKATKRVSQDAVQHAQ